MSQRTDFKKFILRALLKMDGQPMNNANLVSATRDAFATDAKPTIGDVTTAVSELETEGYIAGVQDEFDKTITWSLTTKGSHKAKQIS